MLEPINAFPNSNLSQVFENHTKVMNCRCQIVQDPPTSTISNQSSLSGILGNQFSLIFNAINVIATSINKIWQTITGSANELIPINRPDEQTNSAPSSQASEQKPGFLDKVKGFFKDFNFGGLLTGLLEKVGGIGGKIIGGISKLF